jgi:DNA polymerase II large subunit
MKEWNGNRIKLELAKVSFLSRLEKERQENNISKPQSSSNDLHMIDTNIKSKKRLLENLEFTKKKQKTEENVSVNDYSLDEESLRLSDNCSDCETLYNGKLKMFGGTMACIFDSDSSRSHSQPSPDSKILQSANAATGLLQRLEHFSNAWKDTSVNCVPTKCDKVITTNDYFTKESHADETKKLLAEEKRKKSIEEKRKSFQKQKETIKLALSSVVSIVVRKMFMCMPRIYSYSDS